jgi:osmotically-inducible protein OsmY
LVAPGGVGPWFLSLPRRTGRYPTQRCLRWQAKVYDRPDEEIRDEIVSQVIEGTFCLDPCAFEVTVASGVVTIAGQAESLSAAENLLDAVWDVAGVVDVRDRLSYPDR